MLTPNFISLTFGITAQPRFFFVSHPIHWFQSKTLSVLQVTVVNGAALLSTSTLWTSLACRQRLRELQQRRH